MEEDIKRLVLECEELVSQFTPLLEEAIHHSVTHKGVKAERALKQLKKKLTEIYALSGEKKPSII